MIDLRKRKTGKRIFTTKSKKVVVIKKAPLSYEAIALVEGSMRKRVGITTTNVLELLNNFNK